MDILSYVLGFNKGKAQGGGGGTTETDIFPLQTVEGFVQDTVDFGGAYIAISTETITLVEGETYYVEWDGTTYTCVAKTGSLDDGNDIMYLGNDTLLGGTSDEPFTVAYFVGNGMVGFLTTYTDPSHDIRVYQKGESGATDIEVKPLTVTKNGTYTAPDGEAYSPITVSVPSGGSVDFPYDLEEIFPETELTFKVGNSSYFPLTPTLVVADAEAMSSMEVLKAGDGGLVVWDGELYPVTSGKKTSAPIVSPTGTGIPMLMNFNPCVGNSSIMSAVAVGSTKLVKATKDTPASTEIQQLVSAGSSSEPFFITPDSTHGYIFCDNEGYYTFLFSTIASFIGQATEFQYYGLFTGKGVNEYGTSKKPEPGTVYPVRWWHDIYHCTPVTTTLDLGVDLLDNPIVKEITYLGNGKALGGEDTGEPFVIVFGLEEGEVFIVSLEGSGTVETPLHRTVGVYLPETKHTVQIFKFV